MTRNLPLPTLPQDEWIARCTAKIQEADPMVATCDASELAHVLWERRSCRALVPEIAAEKLFDGNLPSSTCSDL